ncbi:ROK family protein [Halomicrobium salinisoli]|uniref:ROK family protein n=1 Tax=Halomicrobium salinisoli TaxID=2878391 RepID=UPI001CEFF460|nr:ROK family protein [Halomicrobium salinisoli]
MDRVAAFGIGSTNFRSVVATPDGEFLTDVSVEPTRHRELGDQVVAAVGRLAEAVDGGLDAVGVSCTGLVDPAAGTVHEVDTPAGDVVPTVEIGPPVAAAHDLPVALANDCNAAALAEWQFGDPGGHDTVVHLTMGTGIGGGVVEDGRLLRGESSRAGEFGLVPVAPDSDRESTGVAGAWEAFCSGRGVAEFARDLARDHEGPGGGFADDGCTAQDVFAAAAAGDPVAEECLDRVDRYNAVGVAAVCNVVNPGLITLGGGVALNNADRILAGIDRSLDDYLFVDRPEIRSTALGDDVGLYGAVATAVADGADRDAASPSGRESTTD